MVQDLPQYDEQMEKLTLHVEIARKINKIIRDVGLRELGQLEQDLVFGDAGTKEVINFLRTKQDASIENRLRLMMIYASVYPEKFEGNKASKLMQLAKLSPEDMKAVKNMKLLEGSENRKTSGGFPLKFDSKGKHAARKDRTGEEETWQLFRFYPMIEELLEKLNKGELPKDEYQCMNEPSPSPISNGGNGSTCGSSVRTSQSTVPHSMRSGWTATWARPQLSDDGCSSDSSLRNASDFKKMGQRIFLFIIGGATRSELRICHKITAKLRREVVLGLISDSSLRNASDFKKMGQRIFLFIIGGATRSDLRICHKLTAKLREVVLGSTSMDDPPVYITKLKLL